MVFITAAEEAQPDQRLVIACGDPPRSPPPDMAHPADIMDPSTASPVTSTSPPPAPSSPSHPGGVPRNRLEPQEDTKNDVKNSVLANGGCGPDYGAHPVSGRDLPGKNSSLSLSHHRAVKKEKEEEEEGEEKEETWPRAVDVKQQHDLDAPLDFSIKRRDSPPESAAARPPFSSPSPARLSPDSPHAHQQADLQQPAGGGREGQCLERDVDRSPGPLEMKSAGGGVSKLAVRVSQGSPAAVNSSLAALGLVSDGSGGGVSPAALTALLGQNGAMAGPLGSVPSLLEEARKLQTSSGVKVQRPFKAYPKEVLRMPLGYLGLPGVSPFPGMDPSYVQGLTVRPEELMSMYKQQTELLKEREKQTKTAGKRSSRSPPSSAVSPSPALSTNGKSGVTHTSPPPPSSLPASPPQPFDTSLPSTQTDSPSPGGSVGSHTSSTTSQPHDHFLAVSQDSDSTPSTIPSSTAPPLVSSTSSGTAAEGSRKRPRNMPDTEKDDAYWERRRKNNDAAKRSRDARRAKEDEIALRAALLEQENLRLRVEVATLKTETARLRCLLYKT